MIETYADWLHDIALSDRASHVIWYPECRNAWRIHFTLLDRPGY